MRMLTESWIEATAARDGLNHGKVQLITNATQAKASDRNLEAPWLKQRP